MARLQISILALALTLTACQDNPEPAPAPPVAVHAVAATPQLDASRAGDAARLARVADHMPADTMLLISVDFPALIKDGQPLIELAHGLIGAARFETLKADVSALLLDRFGLDPMSITAVSIAVSEQNWGVIFIEGLTFSKSVTRTRDKGLSVISLPDEETRFVELSGGLVVMLPNAEDYDRFTELHQTAGAKLAGSPRFKRLNALLGELKPGGAVEVAFSADLDTLVGGDLPPELAGLLGASLGLGGGDAVSLVVKGDDASITALQSYYDLFKMGALNEMTQIRSRIPKMDVEEALGATAMAHVVEGLIDQLKPSFSGDTARLDVDLAGGTGLILGLAGAGMFFAVSGKQAAPAPSPQSTTPVQVSPSPVQVSP